jgi:hypothetical protein
MAIAVYERLRSELLVQACVRGDERTRTRAEARHAQKTRRLHCSNELLRKSTVC